MFKRGAVLSPREKQGSLQSRLARIDELLAMRARYEALIRQAPATRPAANSRTQGSRQAQYSRTRCEACWSGALLFHENAVECLACSHVGERWYSFDTNGYPGAQSCKHCGSINVVYRAQTLHCKVCGEDSLRWP